jgi:L-malate glycosyltransferase
MKPKIHYHSHAAFFSGAENMISILLQSEELDSKFIKTFSYRYSHAYYNGFKKRVSKFNGKSYMFHFLHLHSYEQLPKFIPNLFKRLTFFIINFVVIYPSLIYQVIALRKLFVKIEPDILHINNAGFPGALSARAAVIAGHMSGVPKIIMVVNNMAVGYGYPSRWLEYPIDKLIARYVDVFITGSKQAADQLKQVLKIESDKLQTIHNGIKLRQVSDTIPQIKKRLELDNFKGVTFGVVALLIPRKGHQVLLDALLKLVSDNNFLGNEFKILIEGVGPLHQELIDFVISNKLTPWVTFVGHEENIIDFMSVLDVLIWPSIEDEDFPNVVSEAMGLGKPVIASRLAGTPEQVEEGKTGLLIEPRNVEQLSRAILQLSKNSDIRKSMGSAALARFKANFSSEIAIRNYNNFYKILIES